ncbi:BQ5605_C012g06978 [Microbotryum silenes-dioicae]|uniref:BQ5605_C012g06978 protein n=1 Tax=Microbotryum silenes-dioicae TaxID=796604 RepID=A0A2X0LSV6_9BASI|nr:BQ5605_C012g06978 [Microbotryum silenes-dioicae]
MLSRTLLRRPAPVRSMLQQRFASSSSSSSSSSSTSAATEQAAQKASDVAAKAKSAAGPAIEKVQQASAKAQALVGNALGAYKEPIFYNVSPSPINPRGLTDNAELTAVRLSMRQAAVAKEIVKQVYVKEKLAPPSLGQVTYVYQQFFNSARDVNYWQQLYKSGEWKRWAIYAVEAYGIFKIGEMIGRRHVVGYKLDESRYSALT